MPFNFSWVLEGKLAGMALPDASAWPVLFEEGIRAVVSLTRRPPGGDPTALGMAVLHVPIADFSAPDEAQVEQCLRFMRKMIDAGSPVVVHCAAGIGRTGTILAAYLVSTGLSAEDAIARVRTLRPGSIETRAQLDLVKRLARREDRTR